MNDTKPSNPKELIGAKKLSMSLVPWTLMVCAARALLEGALKYGRFNWRIAGVSATTYLDALKRHVAKWENGQNRDPKTLVHHLDNAIACLCIMRDAEMYGMLTDDRPPCPDPDRMADLIDSEGNLIAHLKYEFRDHNPKQYSIADTPRWDAGDDVPTGTPHPEVLDQRPEWVAPVDAPRVTAFEVDRKYVSGGTEPAPHASMNADHHAFMDTLIPSARAREALRVNAAIDEVAELGPAAAALERKWTLPA